MKEAIGRFDNYENQYKSCKVAGRTIFLLSNLDSASESKLTSKEAMSLAKLLKENDVELIVG